MQQTISLCQACQSIFTGNLEEKICPYNHYSRPKQVFRHHLSTSSYLEAVRHRCYICYTAWTSANNNHHTELSKNVSNVSGTWYSLEGSGPYMFLQIWPIEPGENTPRRYQDRFSLDPVEGGHILRYPLPFALLV